MAYEGKGANAPPSVQIQPNHGPSTAFSKPTLQDQLDKCLTEAHHDIKLGKASKAVVTALVILAGYAGELEERIRDLEAE